MGRLSNAEKARRAALTVAAENPDAEPLAAATTALAAAAVVPEPAKVDGLAEAATDKAAPVADRISIPLLPNGKIDVASLRDKSKEKLRAAVRATPDLFPAPLVIEPTAVPDFLIGAIYGILGTVEVIIFSKKFPPALVQQIIPYGPEDLEILRQPTQKVVAKYIGVLGRFQDETALVLALANLHIMKMNALRNMMANAAPAAPVQ